MEMKKISRREFIKIAGAAAVITKTEKVFGSQKIKMSKDFPTQTKTTIYRSSGTDPVSITQNLVNSLGGINSIIDKYDIVVIKVNSQWWKQGMTNTDVMVAIIELILEIPDFKGEIIVADNHQAQKNNSRGWTTALRNGRFNLNEIVQYFRDRGYRNVTKYHWHPAGSNPNPLQMDGYGNNVVNHPSEGDGYVWPKDLYYTCPYGNKCILAYPVFTSSYSGITIDLKNGAFSNGKYTGQPVKFINLSALNHHGPYAGVTGSIKNYMGVVDMSCGWPAPNPKGTYNPHHIGASPIFKFLSNKFILSRRKKIPGFNRVYYNPAIFRFRYTGGVLGRFMAKVRKADINIITAINIGWGSRLKPSMAFKSNTLLASKDPVALDYWAAENLLLPATKKAGAPEYYVKLNDPNNENGPFNAFIKETRRELGGTMDPSLIGLVET